MDQDLIVKWWEEIWQRSSHDNTFLSEFDPSPYSYEDTSFIDPDTIIAPRLPNDSVSERGPSPKAFSCRKASNTPDIDFDYGSAIGKSPEECTAYIQDTESMFEVMAVSIENLLCSSVTGHRKVSESRRESYKELKYSSSDHETGQSGQSGGQWESTNTTNSSSVQESVERNREYYENLRKCYDPDPVIITQVIPERGSKSEESTPDIKKGLANFQHSLSIRKIADCTKSIERKLLRRMTTPNFNSYDIERNKLLHLGHSKSFLRKSTSSFDLQFNFIKGQLGAVKELDDEDLTIPFEPKEEHSTLDESQVSNMDQGEDGDTKQLNNGDGCTQSLAPQPQPQPLPPCLKRMRTIVMKSILIDHFIKDVKREIVFKVVANAEEAKDCLHDLPSNEEIIGKKNIRLASPPPDVDLPSGWGKLSYRDLNKQCLSSYSSTGSASGSEDVVQVDDDEDSSWPMANETIDEIKTNYTSISPIMQGPKPKEVQHRIIRKPVARLQRPSQGYLPYIHNSLFQLKLNETLEQTLSNCDSLESSEESDEEGDEDDDPIEEIPKKITKKSLGKRFDSTLCMILPNSYCIPPSSEKTCTS